MLFIMVLFHFSPDKDFWRYGVEQEFRHCFAEVSSTSSFMALIPRLLVPFDILLHCHRGQATGLYLVDSTKLAVCHNARISGSRVL